MKFLISFILLSLLGISQGLDCYQCLWSTDGGPPSVSDCKNGPSDKRLITCPKPENGKKMYCGKKVYTTDEDDLKVERGCWEAEKAYKAGCANEADTDGFDSLEHCQCDEDECNASIRINPGLVIPIASALLAKLFI